MEYSRGELRSVFVAVTLALFLGSLDMAAIPTALPAIGEVLNNTGDVTWVMTAYMLAATVTAPIYGKLSDIFGNRKMFITALSIFTLGATLCACAGNIWQLILFRLVQGMGSGGLMVLAFITVGKIVPLSKQGLYQGLLAGIFSLAALLGPLLGGMVTQYLSWRWMFILYIPLAMTALLITLKSLKPLPIQNQSRQIDIAGAILLTIWIVDFLFLINHFRNILASAFAITPEFIGLACGAVVFLILFILQEKRAINPLLPLKLFQNPVFVVSIIAIFISSTSSFAATFFLPQYFQMVIGVTPTVSGVLLEPVQIGMIIGPIISGWLVARFMSYRDCLLFGVGLAAAMFFMLAWPDDLLVISAVAIPILVILGVGLGMIMPLITVIIQNSVDKSSIGSATASLGLARSMGSLIGVVLFGMVYSGSLAWQLANTGLKNSTIQGVLINGSKEVGNLSGNEHNIVIGIFSNAFNVIFLTAGILALISWGVILFMKRLTLSDN